MEGVSAQGQSTKSDLLCAVVDSRVSRYDGTYPGSTKIKDCAAFTGNGALFADKYKVFLRKFWEAQVISFEKGQGWIYWTWKVRYVVPLYLLYRY